MHDPTPGEFQNDGCLLGSAAVRRFYLAICDLPMLDAHDRSDLAEIVDNPAWSDIWQVEGATDHDVWEMTGRPGIPEEMITGDASNHDKRLAQAGVLRRVPCNVIGDMVERGQIPMPEAVDLVTAIA